MSTTGSVARLERQRSPDRGHRVAGITERLQQIAVTEPVSGDLRMKRKQLAIGLIGLIKASRLHHHLGLEGQSATVARVQCQRAIEHLRRLVR